MKDRKIVLIIDDDEDDRALFLDAVSEIDRSIHCLGAHDGEDALRILDDASSPKPHFIFLDLNMPRLNGKQCLSEIRKRDHLTNIPVIIYSTTRRTEDVEETKKLGAVHFLTKPVLFADICKGISGVLEKKWDMTPANFK